MNAKRIAELIEINKNANRGEMVKDFANEYLVGSKILQADSCYIKYVIEELDSIKIVEASSLDDSFNVIRISLEELEILNSF